MAISQTNHTDTAIPFNPIEFSHDTEEDVHYAINEEYQSITVHPNGRIELDFFPKNIRGDRFSGTEVIKFDEAAGDYRLVGTTYSIHQDDLSEQELRNLGIPDHLNRHAIRVQEEKQKKEQAEKSQAQRNNFQERADEIRGFVANDETSNFLDSPLDWIGAMYSDTERHREQQHRHLLHAAQKLEKLASTGSGLVDFNRYKKIEKQIDRINSAYLESIRASGKTSISAYNNYFYQPAKNAFTVVGGAKLAKKLGLGTALNEAIDLLANLALKSAGKELGKFVAFSVGAALVVGTGRSIFEVLEQQTSQALGKTEIDPSFNQAGGDLFFSTLLNSSIYALAGVFGAVVMAEKVSLVADIARSIPYITSITVLQNMAVEFSKTEIGHAGQGPEHFARRLELPDAARAAEAAVNGMITGAIAGIALPLFRNLFPKITIKSLKAESPKITPHNYSGSTAPRDMPAPRIARSITQILKRKPKPNLNPSLPEILDARYPRELPKHLAGELPVMKAAFKRVQ